jgi:hypothetical protein
VNTLQALLDGPAGAWVSAREHLMLEETSFESHLFGGDKFVDRQWRTVPLFQVVLPGRACERITYDMSDWDGISLELDDYEGEPPTPEEAARLFAMGFTVLRVDYADRERWTTQHGFHGDWSCVHGSPPRLGTPCRVGVDPCPTRFMSSKGTGPCSLLFGHDSPCQHKAVPTP